MQDIIPPSKQNQSKNERPNHIDLGPPVKPPVAAVSPNPPKPPKPATPSSIVVGGKVKAPWWRRAITGIFVVLAVSLAGLVNLDLWLHQFLLNRSSFVSTLAPLSSNPKIQDKVGTVITDQILSSTPPDELATKLLPNAKPGTSDDALRDQLRPVIKDSVTTALKSPQFATGWQEALNSVQSTASNVMTGSSDSAQLDLRPAIKDILGSLHGTPLGQVTMEHEAEILDQYKPADVDLTKQSTRPDQPEVKKQNLSDLRSAYRQSESWRWAVLGGPVLFAILALAVSATRFKTLRKILLGISLELLTLAGLLAILPPLIGRAIPVESRDYAVQIGHQVFSSLGRQSLIYGLVFLGLWLTLFGLHRTVWRSVS